MIGILLDFILYKEGIQKDIYAKSSFLNYQYIGRMEPIYS